MESSDPLAGGDNSDPQPLETHLPEVTPRIHDNSRTRDSHITHLLVKIVLGGVAGLVLGQLILWWLPRPFRRDPFQLAPRLPAAVAFLAPASLRRTPDIANAPVLIPKESTADSTSLTSGVIENPRSLADLLEAAPNSPESPEHLIGLVDVPLFRMRALEASLQRTSRSQDAFVANDDWTPTAVETWYTDLCSLAHDVTFADTRESNIHVFANETREFLVRVADDPRRLRAIVEAATSWIADANSHRKGIVIIGTVKDISASGEMFQTKLMMGEENSVEVMSHVDPRDNPNVNYFEGDRVLIVGVVVNEPSLYLLGYHGDADTLVWGGMPVKLSTVP